MNKEELVKLFAKVYPTAAEIHSCITMPSLLMLTIRHIFSNNIQSAEVEEIREIYNSFEKTNILYTEEEK